jgi:hypothetical protein
MNVGELPDYIRISPQDCKARPRSSWLDKPEARMLDVRG